MRNVKKELRKYIFKDYLIFILYIPNFCFSFREESNEFDVNYVPIE